MSVVLDATCQLLKGIEFMTRMRWQVTSRTTDKSLVLKGLNQMHFNTYITWRIELLFEWSQLKQKSGFSIYWSNLVDCLLISTEVLGVTLISLYNVPANAAYSTEYVVLFCFVLIHTDLDKEQKYHVPSSFSAFPYLLLRLPGWFCVVAMRASGLLMHRTSNAVWLLLFREI